MDRRVRGDKRSKYSKSEVEVESNASCGSNLGAEEEGAGMADLHGEEEEEAEGATVFVEGLVLFLVAAGDGPPPAPFRLVPAIFCCCLCENNDYYYSSELFLMRLIRRVDSFTSWLE
mmetsp:Transcript_29086/g.61438  ORF Transcript_29086/g.61438 Transcript_29086/m.61438 type:complete len:117 (+) Transcript_29086:1693-2043(+)